MSDRAVKVVAIFAHLDSFIGAIRSLRELGYQEVVAVSPVPRPEVDEAMGAGRSPVRVFTLVGGVLGAATGLVLTVATSLYYPLMTSGKPIISIPPFLIIIFELTILFGALATILGMLLNIRLPRVSLESAYDRRFSDDRFGLWVRCPEDQINAAQSVLNGCGAEEVHVEKS
ncbi:MAG: DUF3341 domain-containing protein [Candidatus Methylomirabilales bacterium]